MAAPGIDREYRSVSLTSAGDALVEEIRRCARNALSSRFRFTPTEDDVDSILTLATSRYIEFAYPMTVGESGWGDWISLGIVELH
jgi:hypothetical protein